MYCFVCCFSLFPSISSLYWSIYSKLFYYVSVMNLSLVAHQLFSNFSVCFFCWGTKCSYQTEESVSKQIHNMITAWCAARNISLFHMPMKKKPDEVWNVSFIKPTFKINQDLFLKKERQQSISLVCWLSLCSVIVIAPSIFFIFFFKSVVLQSFFKIKE